MKERLSYESLRTISQALVVLCAVLAAVSLYLIMTTASGRRQTEELEARLLGQVELQTQLLAAQPSDRSVYPHLDTRIGYVLNPYMMESTWNGPEGGAAYPINSIGLRGEDIPQKTPGTTRILLVGDSVIFGWKLADEDRISEVMNTYLADRLPSESIEVLTVALPGWNVLSEKAFLDNHLDVLQPDLIVWKVLGNDIDDVAGVIPPGILAAWNSPQRSGQTAMYTRVDFHKFLAMPAILERWDTNLSAIRSAHEDYGIPVVLFGLTAQRRPFLELLLERVRIDLPTVIIPAELFDDKERWCVTATDCHPSPFATNIIALGLLDRLANLGSIPPLEFYGEEKSITQAFREEANRRISEEDIPRFARTYLEQVPSSFAVGGTQARQSALYGLDAGTGRLSKSGVLFLRAVERSATLDLVLEAPPNPLATQRRAVFTVRNQDGEPRRLAVGITDRRLKIRVPLPDPRIDHVYELSWEFDYASCTNPTRCTSGTLLSVRFGT